VLADPLEWLYAMTLAKSSLPQLSFHRDAEAARVASSLGGMHASALRRFDWSRPVIYMPPFRRLAEGSVVVAVEGYTARRLVELGVRPHVVVSDLDFEPEHVSLGEIAVIHAHGDNIGRLPLYKPSPRIYTVQTWPPPGTYNVGGFTDGDRAAYLAASQGAERIVVSGFYPELPIKRDDEIKRRKLSIARTLLARLSRSITIDFI
jgi:uncharacterized Rossmann fold enzyme